MFGFLLTKQWRDTKRGIELELWFAAQSGPVQLLIDNLESVFFVPQADKLTVDKLLQRYPGSRCSNIELCSCSGEPVAAVYNPTYRQGQAISALLKSRAIRVWESDIRPADRFLMERFITGAVEFTDNLPCVKNKSFRQGKNVKIRPASWSPALKVVSIDIETSMDFASLYSIAVFSDDLRRVFMVGCPAHDHDDDTFSIEFYETEKQCLQGFLDWVELYDPDILIGWNLVQFDLWVLQRLCECHQIIFCLGRNRQNLYWREERGTEKRYVSIPGRVALDGIELLKVAAYQLTRYSLESVSRQLLGEGKLLSGENRGEDISVLFQQNKYQLARYNLKDCELVWDIFAQENLLNFAVERARLTGLSLDRMGGSSAAFDYAYLPRLHRKGYVAPNLGEQLSDVTSPGGYVFDSSPGIYSHILVLDFKSLYPSIIRTFHIDPYAFWYAEHSQLDDNDCIPGFNGARFSKTNTILPEIIEGLWRARESAKKQGNYPLSHAIKIIMNSFYGVMGSPACRFFDPRISSSITLRGHEIMQRSRDWIEAQGYQVIYGDTDSVFVWLDKACDNLSAREAGKKLETELNDWWGKTLEHEFGIKSVLEVEFETHYEKFCMPTIRGSEQGSKKRYAGLVSNKDKKELVFKGLETVRTDWTALAKEFQETLYRKVFLSQPFEEYIRNLAAEVLAGKHDEALIYRKRLHRQLSDYEKNIPPHVQAAYKLQNYTGKEIKRGDWIEYVLTLQGPEPVLFLEDGCSSPIAYALYIERQLAPVADSILYFLDSSFAKIVDRQLPLL